MQRRCCVYPYDVCNPRTHREDNRNRMVQRGGHVLDRLVEAKEKTEDVEFDLNLRPKTLAEYIGQRRTKENLHVFIEAAKGRGEALDHVLLYGPPGLGKTTLAYII